MSLYTDVTFEETDCGLEITGCDEAFAGPDNLAYVAYCAVLASLSEEEIQMLMEQYAMGAVSQATYEGNLSLFGVAELDTPSSISIYNESS